MNSWNSQISKTWFYDIVRKMKTIKATIIKRIRDLQSIWKIKVKVPVNLRHKNQWKSKDNIYQYFQLDRRYTECYKCFYVVLRSRPVGWKGNSSTVQSMQCDAVQQSTVQYSIVQYIQHSAYRSGSRPLRRNFSYFLPVAKRYSRQPSCNYRWRNRLWKNDAINPGLFVINTVIWFVNPGHEHKAY